MCIYLGNLCFCFARSERTSIGRISGIVAFVGNGRFFCLEARLVFSGCRRSVMIFVACSLPRVKFARYFRYFQTCFSLFSCLGQISGRREACRVVALHRGSTNAHICVSRCRQTNSETNSVAESGADSP